MGRAVGRAEERARRRASQKLRDAIAPHGIAEAARKARCARNTLKRYIRQGQVDRLDVALRLSALTGLPVMAFAGPEWNEDTRPCQRGYPAVS